MEKNLPHKVMAILLLLALTGCSIVTGIFKVGFWTGIIVVLLVVGLIIYLVNRTGRK